MSNLSYYLKKPAVVQHLYVRWDHAFLKQIAYSILSPSLLRLWFRVKLTLTDLLERAHKKDLSEIF